MSSKHVSQNKRSRDRARKARRDAREVRELLKMPLESRRGLERRAEHRRRLMMKTLGWLGVLAVIAVASLLLFKRAFYENPEFLMKRMDVETNGSLTREEILHTAEVPAVANLLKLDLKGIDERLEARSQIEEAHVRRVLPDTLEIRVQERSPLAWLGYQGGGLAKCVGGILLDAEGCAIRCDTLHRKFFDFPVILVPKETIEEAVLFGQVVTLEEIQSALRLLAMWSFSMPDQTIEISQIDASRPYRLEVYCYPDLKLLLKYHNLPGQLLKLADVLRHAEAGNRYFAQVDLTVRDNVPVIYQHGGYQPPIRSSAPSSVRPEPNLDSQSLHFGPIGSDLSEEELDDILSVDS